MTNLTMAQLIARHNELAAEPKKYFPNKAAAIAAIEALEAAAETPSELAGLVAGITEASTEAEVNDEQLVSLATICAEIQVVPRIARRRLRKAKGLLTEGRWEFTQDQVDEVKALILGTVAGA